MLKHSLIILSGTVIANLFNVARLFIITRALEPQDFGVWSIFMVVFAYSLYCEFGIVSGMDKLVPFLRGKSLYSEVNTIRNVAFTWMLVVYLVLVIMIVAISFGHFSFATKEINEGIRLLAIVIFLSAILSFYLTVLKAEGKFYIISIASILLSASTVLMLILIYKTEMNKLQGTLLAFTVAYLITLVYAYLVSKLTFVVTMSTGKLKEIFLTGSPLVVIGIGFIVFTSIDRWLVLKYFSKSELGYYALGASLSNLLFGLCSAFAYVFFPKMREMLGSGNDVRSLRGAVHQMLIFVSYFASFLITMAISYLPLIYKFIFPKYANGIYIAQILLAGFYFISITTIASTFLVAFNKQKYVILVETLMACALLSSDYIVIILWHSIKAVAIMTAIVYIVYSMSMLSYAFQCIGKTYKLIPRQVLLYYMPMLLGAALVVLIQVVGDAFSDISLITRYLCYSTIITVSYVLAFMCQMRKEPIMNNLKSMVKLNYFGG